MPPVFIQFNIRTGYTPSLIVVTNLDGNSKGFGKRGLCLRRGAGGFTPAAELRHPANKRQAAKSKINKHNAFKIFMHNCLWFDFYTGREKKIGTSESKKAGV
jgi:hypothetical protein